MIIMNLIIVQIIVLLLLLFFKMPLFLLFTIWTHNILQNLFSVSNFLCLFISLLISLYPTAVTFKLSTDFRQTFEKEKKKEIKIKSPLLLVPFRVVVIPSCFVPVISWFCASISLFAMSAIQFSACICLVFVSFLLSCLSYFGCSLDPTDHSVWFVLYPFALCSSHLPFI